jgi:NAD(P)-dependent dehydrogenase (short-subunit alcohol dehydrogenase family)
VTLGADRPLDGQVAIVTGAAVGVGAAFARALGEAGCTVVLCDVRHDVHDRAATLREAGIAARSIVADVGELADVVSVVRSAGERIDVLVNNAGVVELTPVTLEPESAVDRFDRIVRTNLRGPYLFGRVVIPSMMERGSGHTDHIHHCGWPDVVGHDDAPDCPWSDIRRRPGAIGMDAYDASKWALNGLTQEWAKSLRAHGVRVNNLCLGSTDSHMLRAHSGFAEGERPPAEVLAQWQDPADVARVLVELILEGPGGRTGDNVGLWRGHPTVLRAASPVLGLSSDYDLAEASSNRRKAG